jgi:arylsulfatase A-like enzyme
MPVYLERLLLVLLFCMLYGTQAIADQRPNIVMLFTDDQRFDGVGFMGNTVVQTPHLDSLARQGIVFDQCFVNTSICAISRANLLMGQYPTQHGITDFFKTPTREQLAESVPGRLQESGYQTAFFGKWGIGDTPANTRSGSAVFDYWAGQPMQTCFFHNPDCLYVRSNGFQQNPQAAADSQPTPGRNALCNCPPDASGMVGFHNRIGRAGLTKPLHTDSEIVPLHVDRFLEGRNVEQPFCMFVHFKAPHSPFADWDQEFARITDGVKIENPSAATIENANKEPPVIKKSLGRASGMAMLKKPEQLKAHLRDYYRLISSMDKGVGKIVANLKRRGLHDNTLYLFTSDNGHLTAEHGLMGKWVMYEPSLRVPGFMFDARQPKQGQSISPLVITNDFSATMLAAAGISVPETISGSDLSKLYESTSSSTVDWRDDFFYDHPYRHGGQIPHVQGVRNKDFAYIRYISEDPVVEQLFDLNQDPDQLVNLVANPEQQQRLGEMRQRWRALRDSLIQTQ